MSIHWMNRVWESSQQKGSYLLTLLAIADNANDYGVAWPGYGTLAAKTRLSSRTVQRMVEHLSEEKEIALHPGGGGRRDTNIYVLLLGRTPEEIAAIVKELQNKYVNLTSIKGGQFVYLDKLSTKSKTKKVDTAVSSDPSGTMNDQYEWMNDDPIAKFLCALPGYNRRGIEVDRRKIISGKYDIEELPYLWADAQDKSTVNPIGLFLMMCDSGQHSAAFIKAKADQRDRSEQGADAQDAVVRFEKSTAPERPVVQHPDWDAVLQELRSMWNGQFKSINPRLVAIDDQPNTFTVLVNRATPHMAGDFERMLRGIAPKRQWKVELTVCQ